MIKLWKCEICGDPYIGSSAPDNCPFCGAHKQYIREESEAVADFDVELGEKDRENAEHALAVEVSNAAFYYCASAASESEYGRLLFKALAKVEAEHASIWRKILKLDAVPDGSDSCKATLNENLAESHEREARAIKFYRTAFAESSDKRVKQIFEALVEIEEDHLQFSS